ncbi:lysylphosphatidylglycerol synthase transmembrane domain-containing protein [Rhodococcus opacus]|uniref:TIGR00374 family protein n=1 Tax=Rhodococcus opacus TaxID=37919 RepID=A0A2S8ISW0_RHOOP|nr:YbhN family protein [Rhodococcus opacus]PQP17871.1 TIGR00374 family protein [Rhodococcus opacus]
MNVTDVSRRRSVPRAAAALAAAVALAVEVLVLSPYIARASGTLLHPRWRWLVLAVIAEIASMTTFARLQRQLLAAGGLRVALHRSIALTFASNALSVTLPAGHLVSAGFTFRRLRTWGASTPLVAWTMLASGIISSLALGALGILGATVGVRAHADPLTVGGEILGVLGLAFAIRELVRRPELLVRAGERMLGWANAFLRRPAASGVERVRALVEHLSLVRPRPRDWVLGGVFAALNWIGDLLCLVAACRAVGVTEVGIGLAMTAYVAGMAASSIPLIPGGIGVVDGALIVAFVAGGLGTDEATAAVMLYRLISFALIGAIGWAVLFAARYARGTTAPRRPGG